MTKLRNLVIVRRGRRGPGSTRCARCRVYDDNAAMAEVARPGNSRGVWWCRHCLADMEV